MCEYMYPVDVVPAHRAIRYSGTNSGKIAELIADFTVTAETATDLTFTSGGASHTVARDGWIAYAQGVVTDVFNNADDFADAFTKVSNTDHVHDLALHTGGAKPPCPEY